MKTTSPKSLEAQQKAFFMLSGTSRLRVVNQLMATPSITLTEISKRTGLGPSAVHTALKQLTEANIVMNTSDATYTMNPRTVDGVSNLVEDAAELQFALNKFRRKTPKVIATNPQLRAL